MFKKSFNFTRIFMLAVLCLAFGSVQALAQSQASTGQITGIVADAAGANVPNATVNLTNKGTNATQTVTTTDDGIYRFVLLQPGEYTVKATASGFGEQTLEVQVQIGRTVDANFALGAAGTTATVEITAESIQTTTSNFDAVQNETAINNLPLNGRRFQDLVTLTPNAQVGLGNDTRGQISLSGQRGINSNINVDGVDFNQSFFGGIRGGERSNQAFTIPQESIREFQVVAAGYSAEFGRSSGGIVNVVTKSGDNNFRGTLFVLQRPDKLARGNDYTDALLSQRLTALGVDATLAPTQTQFGGSVGGPIVKDKLFYFASYEQQRFRAPRQVLFPTLIGVAPLAGGQTESFNFYRGQESQYQQTNDANALLGRVDWNINDSTRFNIRYNFSRNNALNAAATGETALDPTTNNGLSNNGTEKDRNNNIVAQLVSTFSSNIVNEARFQYAREDRPRIANQQVANVTTSVGIFGTRSFLPTTQYDIRAQVTDSLTVISGNHTIKFGGEFSNIYANQKFGFNQFGVYTFAGLTTTLNSTVPPVAGQSCTTNPTGCVVNSPIGTPGILQAIANQRFLFVANATASTGTVPFLGRFDTTTARYNQQIGNLQAAFTVRELSFFAQDAWRVTQSFTLNYGLRYEKQYNPSAQANNSPVLDLIKNTAFPLLGGKGIDPSAIPDSQNQFGPRLGFAYSPDGDGKTVIRGFTGIYYARTPLIVLAAPFNNFRSPAGDLSVTLGSPAFNAATFNQATFDMQNPQYVAIVGGTGFAPNTVYRQFAILGINLNNSQLNGLPTLTPTQLQSVADRIQAARTGAASTLGVFQNANYIGINPDFKNPESYQFGGGIEREIGRGLIVGLDFSAVKTVFLQRNRDINLPGPTIFDQVTGRPLVNRNISRPINQIGTLQLRESSARSFYRSATARVRFSRSWGQVSAFYTLSRNDSDDDNERDSGGVLYSNPYDLHSEYGPSRLDRTHQFVANPVFFLPYGFEVSSAVRLRSGTPINVLVGTDLNGDGNNTDRPYILPNFELPRNYYRNRPVYDVDLRVQKRFTFGERRALVFSGEFFNVLNRSNIQLGGTTVTNFCSNTAADCGFNGPTNINFLQTRQQNQTSPLVNQLLLNNNPGSQVFQIQLGAKFQF